MGISIICCIQMDLKIQIPVEQAQIVLKNQIFSRNFVDLNLKRVSRYQECPNEISDGADPTDLLM